jgi:predicted PurR-regulated permease PerM
MIGLSVAVGRFVEALFWAILRVAGAVTVAAVVAAVLLVMAWVVVRKLRRQKR